MRRSRLLGIAGLSAAVIAAVAFAQTSVAPVAEDPAVETTPLEGQAPLPVAGMDSNAVAALADTHWGDPANGATLAGACAACHGLDGNAMQQNAPRIAGQNEMYVARQLALFKSGERNQNLAALMAPFAMPLSAQDMRDLGAHYATQTTGAGVADDTVLDDSAGDYAGMKFYEVGQQLYRQGDFERGLPACMACHGPSGAGNPGPGYPHIGGQEANYTAQRLQLYREGTSNRQDTAKFDIMAEISRQLTDLEIQSLSSYLQGLHARPDAATARQIAQAAAAAPAPAPAPAAAPAAGDAEVPAEAPAEAPADAPATDPATAPGTEPAAATETPSEND